MSRQETILRGGFTLLSVVTSFIFVAYGLGALNATSGSTWLATFAYVTIGYGLGYIYLLSWAWRSRAAWTVAASKLIALCFFGVFALQTYNSGGLGTQQLLGVLLLAVVLWINWLTIQKQVSRPE